MSEFTPDCRPVLIGSLPFSDHQEACDTIFQYTAEIPLWPQLPCYKQEGMIPQYVAGMPGLTEKDGKLFIDSETERFQEEMLGFYEEYLMVTEGGADLDESRFRLSEEDAKGFYRFLSTIDNRESAPVCVKGQTTGPVTFATGLVDQAGRAIYYDDQLRDIAVKNLAMKARWQVAMMKRDGVVPIMFFDEPGLAGLGSSAFITITQDDIIACLTEVFEGVRQEGGLTGVHVCANTEWPVLFDSGVDIISYDAFSYFDRLILFTDQLKAFLHRGGMLATGIVPTTAEEIDAAEEEVLVQKWFDQAKDLEQIGIPEETVYKQSFITPSCGTGTVTREQSLKVLGLTKSVSEAIRKRLG